MPRLLEADMRDLYRAKGIDEAGRILDDALATKQIRPDEFSIRRLAESFMGVEWVKSLDPKAGRYERRSIQEATADAVSYSDFSHITGQIFFNTVKEGYELEAMPFSDVIPSKPSDILDMERIPGIGQVGDEFTAIGEGDEYPNFGVSEDYQDIARKVKRGGIIDVTKEAILGDRTGQLLKNCHDLGKWLKLNKEKRLIDAYIDEGAGAVSAALGGHRYYWRGTSYANFQTSATNAPYYDNVTTGNALVDETDLENAWLTLTLITDPYTGEPIENTPTHMVVTPQNVMTAFRILRAIQVRVHAGGYPTSGNPVETVSPSALQAVGLQGLQVLTSKQLAARAATDTDWWLGSPGKSRLYSMAWDITPEEAPTNSREAFRRDIQMSHKISEMGTAATLEPRLDNESQA